MFDEEEKPKTTEQQVAELKEDILFLTRRIIKLEDEMKIVKDRKMSFSPGL